MPTMATEATASQPTPEPCSEPTPEPDPNVPTPAPTSSPIKQDGRTFYLYLSGSTPTVVPTSLKVGPNVSSIRFLALSGAWEVVSQDSMAYPGVGADLGRPGQPSERDYPVWQLFDPDLSYMGNQMRFTVNSLYKTGTGYYLPSGTTFNVTVTK